MNDTLALFVDSAFRVLFKTYEFFGLSEPEWTALLNGVWSGFNWTFAGLTEWYIRVRLRAILTAREISTIRNFYASLVFEGLHRLWWNIGIWTALPGAKYGIFIQEHRAILWIPVVVSAVCLMRSVWLGVGGVTHYKPLALAASVLTGWLWLSVVLVPPVT